MSASQLKGDGLPPPPIPEGCRPLSHQVAGHIYGKCKTRAGLLQDNNGSILKLMQTNNRGTREKKFYQVVFGEDQSDTLLLRVKDLVCPYEGTVVSSEDPTVEYIKLRDMTHGFVHPCIMDVKIGRIGYTDGDNAKKAQMAKQKYPHMDKLGFQVLGMRVYHPLRQKYCYYDKAYGRSLDVTSMIEGLAKFFNVEEKIRTDVMYSVLVRLQQILDWFEDQSRYHFYSSSLLFIYEASLPPDLAEGAKTHAGLLSHSFARTAAEPSRNGIASPVLTETKPDTYPLKRKKMDGAAGESADPSGRARIWAGGPRRSSDSEDGIAGTGIGEEGDTSGAVAKTTSPPTQGSRSREQKGVDDEEEEEGRHHVDGGSCNGVRCGDGNPASREVTRCGAPWENLHSGDRMASPECGPHGEGNQSELLRNGPAEHFTGCPCFHPTTVQSKRGNGGQSKENLRIRNRETDSRTPARQHHSMAPVDIRMIDFAHAIESSTRDENYIFGLKMLMQYIETLHNCFVG